MPALMPCSMTIPAVIDQSKDVTRRDPATWLKLKAGDHLTLCEKRQGIPKGGHVVKLAEVQVIDVRVELLLAGLNGHEIEREGVRLDLTEVEWAKWWASSHGWRPVATAINGGPNLDLRYGWYHRAGDHVTRDAALETWGLRRPKLVFPVHIVITDHCRTGNLRDPEACAPTVKWVIDALTAYGLWADDNAAHIARVSFDAPTKTGIDELVITIHGAET